MGPRETPRATIRQAFEEFLNERSSTLPPSESRLYRHVLRFLELCLNHHGYRNLDEEARSRYERLYRDFGSGGLEFTELFEPEKILPELDFFTGPFLKKDVHTSERVLRRAKDVVLDLRQWLVDRDYLTPETVLENEAMSRAREKVKNRLRRHIPRLRRSVVSVDPANLSDDDYVLFDDHLVGRVEAGEIWLRVHRAAVPDEIGPVALPEEVTRHLRRGFTLCCSLGRLRGRWRLLEFSDINPRG
jgi:hypothetical protein